MLKKIIYITGNNRSGSTVLDFLLGEHPLICSLGELHHFQKYVIANSLRDSDGTLLLCSCGKKVGDCDFWKTVEKFLGKPLNDVKLVLDPKKNLKQELNIGWFFKIKNLITLKNKLASKIIKKYPILLNSQTVFLLSGYNEIAFNHFELCEAVSQATLKPYIVDSSKNPHRFKYLSMLNKEKVIIIHLVRHPAGVVFSMMKRGLRIEDAIQNWFVTEKAINALLKNICPENKMFVRYEDLCTFPEKTISSICDKLNIKYDKKMTNLTIENKHHIQGSPSKFQYNGKIIYDEKYTEQLSPAQINYIIEKTSPYSKRYGYYKVKITGRT